MLYIRMGNREISLLTSLGVISGMKIVLGMLAILVLMTLTPSVFAISNYQPGFNHGVREAKCTSVGCREYIIQQGNGLGFLRRDFINRYVNGYCSIALP